MGSPQPWILSSGKPPTAYDRRQKLKAMTEGLNLKGSYGETLELVKEHGGDKIRLEIKALMWVTFGMVITAR